MPTHLHASHSLCILLTLNSGILRIAVAAQCGRQAGTTRSPNDDHDQDDEGGEGGLVEHRPRIVRPLSSSILSSASCCLSLSLSMHACQTLSFSLGTLSNLQFICRCRSFFCPLTLLFTSWSQFKHPLYVAGVCGPLKSFGRALVTLGATYVLDVTRI